MTYFDYNIFYKTALPLNQQWLLPRWDVFVSAFNSSERVRLVFDKVTAGRKYWLIHREYGYAQSELPQGNVFTSSEDNEAAFVKDLIVRIEGDTGADISGLSICVDLTGFMRPHLLFLALYLAVRGVGKYDVLYTEPERYAKKEETTFSEGGITVRQVAGFEGVNSPDHGDDFLIIGSGYDHRLIKAVAEYKDKADKVQIYGLPSLRADMYQENVLNAFHASDAIGINKVFDVDVDRFFAPANDPFVTASTLSEIVDRRRKIGPISNLYLSPLATKPQALGFALFYLGECQNSNASILFPISTRYTRETSHGLSRVWMYTIEYPLT
jgi:hypothetical protein